MILLAVDREQVRSDVEAIKPIFYVLFFVAYAVFWIGENQLWNVVPQIVETVFSILATAIVGGWVLFKVYDRYTISEAAENTPRGERG